MIDHFYGDAAGFWFVKRPGCVAFERSPGFLVDFGFESGLEGFVRIICTEKVGMTGEETLFVVIGIDEPAGNIASIIAADFASIGMKHINAIDLNLDLTIIRIENINIRFAKDNEEIAFAGILQVISHVEIGIHPRFEDRNATELVELRGMGFVVERRRQPEHQNQLLQPRVRLARDRGVQPCQIPGQ